MTRRIRNRRPHSKSVFSGTARIFFKVFDSLLFLLFVKMVDFDEDLFLSIKGRSCAYFKFENFACKIFKFEISTGSTFNA